MLTLYVWQTPGSLVAERDFREVRINLICCPSRVRLKALYLPSEFRPQHPSFELLLKLQSCAAALDVVKVGADTFSFDRALWCTRG